MADSPTFYIFHGNDSIRLQRELGKMSAALGEDGDLNRSDFDGAETPAVEALAAVKSLPFLAEKRLVIVRGLISHITRAGAGAAGKKAVDRLIAELPSLPDYARLALVESQALPESNRVLKAARQMKNGYIGSFQAPKNLTGWIVKRAKDEYGAAITSRAASAIAAVVQHDVRRADNELHKLVCYVDGEHAIDEADVAALTPYLPEANVFETVDAIALGDGDRALELIDRSLRENPRDPGFGLFSLIVRHFRLLLMAKDYLNQGGQPDPPQLSKALGAHPFSASKAARQSNAFTPEQLDRVLRRLQRYDQDMKTGRIEPRLALDLLVSSLARQK